MNFLKHKFFDHANLIEEHFLTTNGELKPLEDLSRPIREQFADNYFAGMIGSNSIGFTEKIYNLVDKASNPWSLDFPSWIGPFNPESGRRVLVIGSEPHIEHNFLQTVYGFHTRDGQSPDDLSKSYRERQGSIFQFLSVILSPLLGVPEYDVLKHCYLTDLIPFAPMKSKHTRVGETSKIASFVSPGGNWYQIRRNYAQLSLQNEITGVKPELIITQGKEVFYEVLSVLGGSIHPRNELAIESGNKRKQFVRSFRYGDIQVVSVPHIGSKRMKGYWNRHVHQIRDVMLECVKISKG